MTYCLFFKKTYEYQAKMSKGFKTEYGKICVTLFCERNSQAQQVKEKNQLTEQSVNRKIFLPIFGNK